MGSQSMIASASVPSAGIRRCTGEAAIAAELREIAAEIPCGQRQMHLEIAAQIIEQGQFLHPDNFGLLVENDELRAQIAQARRPMETAPKDRPILAWCDDECRSDRCGYHTGEGTSLCLYHGHADGLSSAGTGWRIVEWGGAWDDSTWEDPNGGSMPDWWFRAGSEFEEAANPVFWMTLPDVQATPLTGDTGK